ncbi:hypothetical protein GCM10022288_07880 [Gryllotalpicola kribbensis]|uniref:Uncharacterized protein n=1 Tax=Gryllotalpicola kribbensis TaxID=993084 RepID=A0ABP8ALH0_9MICO
MVPPGNPWCQWGTVGAGGEPSGHGRKEWFSRASAREGMSERRREVACADGGRTKGSAGATGRRALGRASVAGAAQQREDRGLIGLWGALCRCGCGGRRLARDLLEDL